MSTLLRDPLRHKCDLDETTLSYWFEIARSRELPGQLPRGTRVAKCVWEPGDLHGLGAEGELIGCVGRVEGEYCYLIRWDDLRDRQDVVTFVIGRKIQTVAAGRND